MGIQDSLDNLYSEIVNRWQRLRGSDDPNLNSSLDSTPLGEIYQIATADPTVLYIKNRNGTNGWDRITTGGQGSIYASSASVSGGEISNQVYANPPTDSVLIGFTSSSSNIDLDVSCSYPLAKVITSQGTYTNSDLTPTGIDFSGTISIVVGTTPETIEIVALTPNGKNGARSTLDIEVELPPEIVYVNFTGTYPRTQTEYKAGDTVQIIGTVDVPCSGIEIMGPTGLYSDGACVNQVINFAPTTAINVIATIADQGDTVVARPAYIRAKDASGAYGGVKATNTGGGTTDHQHLVNCNNFYFDISIGTITYPLGQGALKNSETATVANTVPTFSPGTDSISYTSPNGDLSITNSTAYESPKTVQRIGGTYNDSVNNFQIVAIRKANAAVTTNDNTIVEIANVAPVITVAEPYTRLRSGGNDGTSIQNHTITLTSNQKLNAAPTLGETPGSGTFIGSWAGGPKIWTRTLQVHDNDPKGTYSYVGLVATNKALLVQNTISGSSDYILGGFVARTLTFGPYSQTTTLNVAVTDYSKIGAGIFTATNQPAVRHSPQGDHADAVDEYTIDSPLGTNPQTLWWNDVSAASSNSSGTATITNVQETV